MTKYPLTYEEYEKEVFRRFSEEQWDGYTKEDKVKLLKKWIKEEAPGFMKHCYKTSNSGYDRNAERWRSLGVSEEQIIENLFNYPMNNLHLLLG